MSTSEPPTAGTYRSGFPQQRIRPPLDTYDDRLALEDWNCVTKVSRCQRERRNRQRCGPKVGLLVVKEVPLCFEG